MAAQVFSHLSSDLRRSGIVPRILIVLIFLLLLPLPSATAEPGARLLDLGWTTQDGAVKIVAHLDRPVRFRATTTGGRLIVDLWPIVDPEPRELAVNTGGVGTVRQVTVERGIARLSLSLRGATRYNLFTRSDPYKLAVVVLPPWRATVPLPQSVAYQKVRVRTGRGWTDAHVVLVDMADPQIALRPVLGSGVIPGNEPTAAAATRSDALVAINGGFFTVSTGHPLGLLVIDGKLLSTPTGRRSVFAITADGQPVIQSFTFRGTVETDTGRQIPVSAVNRPPRAGGARLVVDGEVSVPYRWESFGSGFSKRRTSRSAVGITAAGKVLLVTVEKSRRNTGMNLFELARLMRDLGAVQAMNLDGGGSSTLVVGGRVVNRAEGAQRGVASMLLVVRKPPE